MMVYELVHQIERHHHDRFLTLMEKNMPLQPGFPANLFWLWFLFQRYNLNACIGRSR